MINALLLALAMGMLGLSVCWTAMRIHHQGIQFGTAVIAGCVLFYQIVPLVFYLFPAQRDTGSVYNAALLSMGEDALMDAMLQASALVLLLIVAYSLCLRNGRIVLRLSPEVKGRDAGFSAKEEKRQAKHMAHLADFFFFLGATAIVLCMVGAGGIRKYWSLGALTRGVGKNAANGIDRVYLPLITLSSVILLPPFLYSYACRCGKGRGRRICFYASLLLALLYLVYNQGRMPLVIFLLPFFMDSRLVRKMGMVSLILLFIFSCLLLQRLSSLFNYLSYGRWYDQFDNSLIRTLLREFTYPYSSFAHRRALLERMGMRWGSDLVTWPAVTLPSFVMELFGVDKRLIVTLGETLTDTFSLLTGMERQGGVPSDLFFFLYAQFGNVSLVGGVFLLGLFLSFADRRFAALRGHRAADILILRSALLGISCVNHFDVAVVVRTRFDLLALLVILFCMTPKRRNDRP